MKATQYESHNSAESIEKIKKEYHIKDETGELFTVKEEGERHVKKEDKDRTIKAEPGHHDKISSGLFPSDIKMESSSSWHSSTSYEMDNNQNTIKLETCMTDEITRVKEDIMRVESSGSGLSTGDAPVQIKASSTDVPVAMGRSQRRGRSAHSITVTHDDDDYVVFLKRRGAILR